MKDEVHQLPELMPDKRVMLLDDAEFKPRECKFLLKIAERVWKQGSKSLYLLKNYSTTLVKVPRTSSDLVLGIEFLRSPDCWFVMCT